MMRLQRKFMKWKNIMNLKNLSDDELRNLYLEKKKQATQLHNSQMAIKISMNSLYGACANL